MGDLASNISNNIAFIKDLKYVSILICIILFINIVVRMSRDIVYDVLHKVFSNKNAFLHINSELSELIQIYVSMIVLFSFSGPPILGNIINAENIDLKVYIGISVIFGIAISSIFRILSTLNNNDVNFFIYCHGVFTVIGYIIYLYLWHDSGNRENYAMKIWSSFDEMLKDGLFQNLILMFLLIVVGTELIIYFMPSRNRINLSKTEYKR